MLRFPLATSLIGMLATPFARASPINIRSPGDPAPIDIRIWALPNSHTTTGISTLINGQEQFRETTAEDFAFQPARKPSGSDQEYNMVGVMTFDVVPDKPRAMYITSDTLPAGANCTVFFTEKYEGTRFAVEWFAQHGLENKPGDMEINCGPGGEGVAG